VYDSFCGGYGTPKVLERIQGLIFDCDGVLFDSFESNRVYYNTILSKMHLPPMTLEQEAYVHVHAVRESLLHIVPAERAEEIEWARKQVDYFREIMPHLRPEPGVFELLSGLRERGILLSMNTNRTSTMDRLAARFGLDGYFFPIMTASKAAAKPHPEGANYILRRWGLPLDRVAYIGDSRVDEDTAAAAGVPFWAYKNPSLNAVLHIEDFWQLIRGFELRSQTGVAAVGVPRWSGAGWPTARSPRL
jgi:HAD superfamily hydrolase (TIGR01509 family)